MGFQSCFKCWDQPGTSEQFWILRIDEHWNGKDLNVLREELEKELYEGIL